MECSEISQPSARPSLIVCSIARLFGTGSAPGCARQTGHVSVFSSAPYSSAQRQNIFVLVFRCTCTSSPITASHSAEAIQPLLRLEQRLLDVVADLDHAEAVLEHALRLDQPELALAGFQLQLHVADEHGARAVQHARLCAEDLLHRGDEVRRGILEPHRHVRRRSGTGSKPIACSSARPTSKRRFSENCGPISCRPTGSPSLRPHGMFSPGSPAMHEGIVRRSDAYIASGFAVFAPSSNATVGEVGDTSTSKRSNASACSRIRTVRTFCACP